MSETAHHPETLEHDRDNLIKDLGDLVEKAAPWGSGTRISMGNVMSKSLSNGEGTLSISRPMSVEPVYREPGSWAARIEDFDGSTFSSQELYDRAYAGPTRREVYVAPPQSEWPDTVRNEARALKVMSGLSKIGNHLTNFTSISDAEERRAQTLRNDILDLLLEKEVARPATDDELARLNKHISECMEPAS